MDKILERIGYYSAQLLDPRARTGITVSTVAKRDRNEFYEFKIETIQFLYRNSTRISYITLQRTSLRVLCPTQLSPDRSILFYLCSSQQERNAQPEFTSFNGKWKAISIV